MFALRLRCRASVRPPGTWQALRLLHMLYLLWYGMALQAQCPPAEQRGAPADRLYVHGTVLSMDEAIGTATAVAVRDGRIAAVGDDDAVSCLQGPSTQVTDLVGRTLLPGFIDSHSHLAYVGIYNEHAAPLYGPPIGTVDSMEGLLAALRDRAAATPAGEWVYGVGYDDTTVRERRHPTRHDLDRVSTRHPIWLYHMSFHYAAVNTLGLTRLGITADTKDPAGGTVHRDPGTRVPNGLLEEGPALQLGFGYDLPITDEEAIQAIRGAADLYASRGFTTAQSGQASVRQFQLMQRAYTEDASPSVRLMVYTDRPATAELLAGRLQPDPAVHPDMMRIAAAKLFADGAIQGYTAYLREPYFRPPGDKADFRGYPQQTIEELTDTLSTYCQQSLRVAVHANGDAAIDQVLDAWDNARRAVGRCDDRLVIIHAQMARREQLQRMKVLGAIPSFFILHTYYYGDAHIAQFLGRERAFEISPARWARDLDIPYTIHMDSPVVPVNALDLLWAAVHRNTRSGVVLGPKQRVDVLDALKAMTINAAWQYRQEDVKGSVTPGKFVDLVVLSANPLVDPGGIRDIRIEETVLGGRVVYRRNQARDAGE